MTALQLSVYFQGKFNLSNEQCHELANAINEHFQEKPGLVTLSKSYDDPFDEEEDDDEMSFEEWAELEEERREEEEATYAATCTCGAWQFAKDGTVVHIADCFCGAQ
jgi:hypothetical protein